MCVQALRVEAEKYRRLANSIYNPNATAELEAHARALEERATQLEEGKRAPRRGDAEGQAVWKRIVEAILELLRGKPQESEPVN
jgi:hypothetical protein